LLISWRKYELRSVEEECLEKLGVSKCGVSSAVLRKKVNNYVSYDPDAFGNIK
jgi:hypothetical protein